MPESDPKFQALLEEKEAIEKAARINRLHWFIIFCSLTLTFSAWYVSKAQVQEKINIQFAREAERVTELVKERLEKYENALLSGVATIDSQSYGITYEEWKRFSDTLRIDQKYPGINGIGVIFYLKNENEKKLFLEKEHQNRANFSIHPQHKESEFWPITLIEPESSNKKALGLDIAHEKTRYEAAQKARDTGKPQITGPITLVQDIENTPGFLFYVPFYKNNETKSFEARQENFIGLVYAPFIFKKLIKGTLEKQKRYVGLQILDGDTILYDEHIPEDIDYDPTPLFKTQYKINTYGREWIYNIWSTKSFNNSLHDNKPVLILVSGLLIDVLLLFFFIFMSRSNHRAIEFANKMTEGYKHKNEALEKLIERIMDSNQELERFAYVAAHDMQEPLRMTSNFSELLHKEYLQQLDDQGKEFLRYCMEGSKRLQNILDDLLEYSKIGEADTKKELFSSDQILKTILENLNEPIKESKAEIIAQNMPEITGNPMRFSRLLQNLIENAIKYQKKDNIPIIQISAKETDMFWIFKVKDNGIGIKAEYQEQIFEPFKRLHSSSEYPGTGIGLAICSKIVNKMGGELWVESEFEKGSTFSFSIPKI